MKSQPDLYVYELRIPKERVAVLIGVKGAVKRQLEHLTKTSIHVDSGEGMVSIAGKDALLLYSSREIIRAIGRGFNPEIARNLIKPDYGFDVISLIQYVKTKKDLARQRGRVIGENGKSRRTIEELTGTYITVSGKTIGVIGLLQHLPLARRAIEALLRGSSHANVYRTLERKRKEMKIHVYD